MMDLIVYQTRIYTFILTNVFKKLLFFEYGGLFLLNVLFWINFEL